MTEIEYHAPRLPDEEEIWEVRFSEGTTRGSKHIGSVFFRGVDNGFVEVDTRMHGTRKRSEYLPRAAKDMIREKKEQVVYSKSGDPVAELEVYCVEEVDSDD